MVKSAIDIEGDEDTVERSCRQTINVEEEAFVALEQPIDMFNFGDDEIKKGIFVLFLATIFAVLLFRGKETLEYIGYENPETMKVATQECPSVLPKNQHELNRFRRELAMSRPECYEDLFPYLMNRTLSRVSNKIFHLHIPKTGGSSLCQLAREQPRWQVPESNNCWLPSLCPFWCNCIHCQDKVAYTPCEVLEAYDFVGNERFLDYHNGNAFCEDFNFIITLREPRSQLASILRDFHRFKSARPDLLSKRVFERIVELDYFMWALLAGQSDDWLSYRPNHSDLERAKHVLMGFDFVLDVAATRCVPTILRLMNISGSLPLVRHAPKKSKGNVSEALLRRNLIDVELYNFSKTIMEIDCDYFERIVRYLDLNE